MKRQILLLLFIALACSMCSGEQASPPAPSETASSAPSTRKGRCGDGICDGPENAVNCLMDCQVEEAFPTKTTLPTPVVAADDVPPLYFFYAIHAHGSGEHLPYQGPSLLNIDPLTANNIIAAIEDIANVLDQYGVKGTWEFLPATATGLCSYQGENHILQQLINAGHEVGTHAHRIDDIKGAYQALQEDCDIIPKITSGFLAQISSFDTNEVQAAMSLSIQASVELGMTIGTTNLSPGGGRNPFAEICDNQIGLGNTMWVQSGNLMFPWKPDILNQDICNHSAEGEIVLIDHVSIEWIKLPGQEGVPDVLSEKNFDQLRSWFDGALQFMEEERPQRVAAWGFVTHITEYAIGSKAEHTLDPGALRALEEFLAYVDSKRVEGRVVYATVSEIANLVNAGP